MKLIRISLLSVLLCFSSVNIAFTQSANDFFNSLFSQAFFLEQCIANKIISSTEIHNQNIRKAKSLGYSLDNFWKAGQNGAKGMVFDMIKNNWIRVPMDRTNCTFVEREQAKFHLSLSRY